MTYNRTSIMHHTQPNRALRSMCLAAACVFLCLVGQLRAQGSWVTRTAAHNGRVDLGQQPTLVVDRAGNLHVGYYDATDHALLYAYQPRGDGRWYNMVVAPKNVAPFSSLAVDSQGHPHFSWVSRHEDGLHYGYYDGKSWKTQIVDSAKIDYFNSIQLDSNGHPRISYYLYHGEGGAYILKLKYANFDGKSWFIQTVDQRMSTGKFNSIAVDSAGNPYIAYSHVGLGDLLYAHFDGKEWHFSDVDARRNHNSYVGIGNSIAVDSKGNPHIAYFDLSKRRVKYAYWDGTKWQTEVVNQMLGHGELDRVSLKLDGTDRPHIAFYDAGTGVLKYAVRKTDAKPVTEDKAKTEKPKIRLDKVLEDEDMPVGPENWNVEVVDKEGNVGMNPSLALDSSGTPYIAYYDATNHALKIAYYIPGAVPPKAQAAVAK